LQTREKKIIQKRNKIIQQKEGVGGETQGIDKVKKTPKIYIYFCLGYRDYDRPFLLS
jgi:hypothetical protein